MPLQVIIPNDLSKIDRQISALEAVILEDTPKDREIHAQALRNLQERKKELLNGQEQEMKAIDKEVIEILKNFDNLILDIPEMAMKVRIGDAPFRDATDSDKLDFLREEWFKVTEKLNELGYQTWVS